MKIETRKKLSQLFDLCVELNKPDLSVFFDYNGRHGMVSIRLFLDGWEAEADPDYKFRIFFLV